MGHPGRARAAWWVRVWVGWRLSLAVLFSGGFEGVVSNSSLTLGIRVWSLLFSVASCALESDWFRALVQSDCCKLQRYLLRVMFC